MPERERLVQKRQVPDDRLQKVVALYRPNVDARNQSACCCIVSATLQEIAVGRSAAAPTARMSNNRVEARQWLRIFIIIAKTYVTPLPIRYSLELRRKSKSKKTYMSLT